MRHILLISLFILLFSGLNTGYAQLSADPEGVTASMEVNNQAETEVIITNSGDSDVPFEIKIEAIDLSEDDDNRDVPPRRDRRGGPVDDDDYRYEWRDNDENDGPEYEWIDIREFDGVRSQSQSDDEIHGPFEFGWNIPFYDEEFDRCWICSDGWASLQRSQYARNVPDLPNNDQSWFATVLWSDGDWHGNLNGAGPAYFWTNEEDMAIVTWHQYDARDNGSHADVQVIFQDNGMITIQYGDSFGEGNRFGTGEGTYGAEAGINGLGGDYPGFQFKPPNQQNDYLVEGRAIGFGPARAWLNWIVADCEEGVIEAQSEFNLTLQLNTEDMEAGYYYSIVRLLNPENDDIVLLEFPTILSIDSPIYNITGTVTDAGNDNVIDDALVTITPYDIKRGSNNDGEYEFTNLHLGEYEFLFTAPDFLPHTETVEIDDEGDYELNVELLHSECTPSERQFTMQLEPGYTHEFEFQIDNGGNGPLTYAVDRRLLGDANAEPFELRQTDEIEDLTGDDMLAGAVFAEEQFFISGGNNGNNPNKIYVLNTDMEVVNEFDQFVDDRYGMRDLAYDGELIWGAVEGTFYGFTTTGDLEIEFSVDANLEGRAIAWDPVDEVLLASDISTDIFAINRDGDVVETYRRPAELRIYGLGVWPDDPDDCYLYVFCRGPDNVG
ncbi:carboxypeptidase-like regulatory domain-containing protein, partial [bacterium]|nr:carboxypeptidase-like regulatory domain-containing protein [bacterium]